MPPHCWLELVQQDFLLKALVKDRSGKVDAGMRHTAGAAAACSWEPTCDVKVLSSLEVCSTNECACRHDCIITDPALPELALQWKASRLAVTQDRAWGDSGRGMAYPII